MRRLRGGELAAADARSLPPVPPPPPAAQSFFERWWRRQGADTRALVTRLVADGQASGGGLGAYLFRCLSALTSSSPPPFVSLPNYHH